MATELDRKNGLVDESTLQKKLDAEKGAYRELHSEWRHTTTNLGILSIREDAGTSSVAHIDFKVRLFTVRERLRQKAETMNIKLPGDLGLDETIVSNEDAFERMRQLQVVEKLVDLALDLKIKTVRGLRPLPPVAHRAGSENVEYFREYPVELDLNGSQEDLYELLNVAMTSNNVFVLRGLRAEPTGRRRSDLLSIKAVMSALVFLKEPGDIPVPSGEIRAERPRRPLGH